jgi:hypothetical protein
MSETPLFWPADSPFGSKYQEVGDAAIYGNWAIEISEQHVAKV